MTDFSENILVMTIITFLETIIIKVNILMSIHNSGPIIDYI